MQPQSVHQPVHHEGGAIHVAGVLQQRQEEIEEEKHRHEDQHPIHAGDDAIYEERLHPCAIQADEIENGYYPTGDRPADDAINPIRVRAGDLGRHLEDKPHDDQEDGDAQHAVGDNPVSLVRGRQPLLGRAAHYLFDQATDETIPAVGYDGVHIVAVDTAQMVHTLTGLIKDRFSIRHRLQSGDDLRVPFQRVLKKSVENSGKMTDMVEWGTKILPEGYDG